MIAGAGSFLYFAQNVTDILLMGARIEPLHVALGVVGTLVLVELCRRCVGLPIIIVVCCLIAYAFYWQLSSSSNGDLYSSLRKIVQKLFYTTSGVIGTPINVCCTYIVLFVIFGAFWSARASRTSSSRSPTASQVGRAAARRRCRSWHRRSAAWFRALRSATP